MASPASSRMSFTRSLSAPRGTDPEARHAPRHDSSETTDGCREDEEPSVLGRYRPGGHQMNAVVVQVPSTMLQSWCSARTVDPSGTSP